MRFQLLFRNIIGSSFRGLATGKYLMSGGKSVRCSHTKVLTRSGATNLSTSHIIRSPTQELGPDPKENSLSRSFLKSNQLRDRSLMTSRKFELFNPPPQWCRFKIVLQWIFWKLKVYLVVTTSIAQLLLNVRTCIILDHHLDEKYQYWIQI